MVTWQGSAPRSWSSASSARRGSPEQPADKPGDGGEPDAADEEALQDDDGLVDKAEAVLVVTSPAAATSAPMPYTLSCNVPR